MSSLKWTGKGLQFTNKIVPIDIFEGWLDGEGDFLLEERIGESSGGIFRKRAKAKKSLFEDMKASLSNETVKLAMLSRLVRLPTIIESVAKEIKNSTPELITEVEMTWVGALPRYSVRKAYSQYVVNELKNAEELARYPYFARLYLKQLAEDSEESFFARTNKNRAVCEQGIILGVDPDYYWHLDPLDGHYYFARSSMGTDMTKRSDRNKLVKGANAMLEDFQVKLGLLTSDEKHRVAEGLR